MLRRNLHYSNAMHRRAIESMQRGLGALGTLIVLALAAAAGYYLYINFNGGDEKPTCSEQFESCMQICNRTQTENTDMQGCRKKCEEDQSTCRWAATHK